MANERRIIQKPIINFDMHVLIRLKPLAAMFFIGSADIFGCFEKSIDTMGRINKMTKNTE
jgi:hypothetical protein